MAAPDQAQAIWVTGRLAANCSDLGAAYPHGGTALGLCGNIGVKPGALFRLLVAEENNAPYKIIWLGGPVECLITIQGWEASIISNLFRGGGAGPKITLLGTEIGTAPTPLDNLVWAPRNPNYPFLVLRDVVAVPQEDHLSKLSSVKQLDFRVRCFATDVSDSLGELGPSGDVSL